MEGTLAKTIINEPKEVTLMNGLTAPLNMQVHYISFSAHADFARKLITQFAYCNTKIISPNNCQSVEMYFNSEKMAKTIGRVAEKTPEVGETVSNLLVKKAFTYQIMAPETRSY